METATPTKGSNAAKLPGVRFWRTIRSRNVGGLGAAEIVANAERETSHSKTVGADAHRREETANVSGGAAAAAARWGVVRRVARLVRGLIDHCRRRSGRKREYPHGGSPRGLPDATPAPAGRPAATPMSVAFRPTSSVSARPISLRFRSPATLVQRRVFDLPLQSPRLVP